MHHTVSLQATSLVSFYSKNTTTRDEQGAVCKQRLTDEEVVAHINSLVGGGLGTTNVALSFVLHELTVNPKVQQLAYEYILDYCGKEVMVFFLFQISIATINTFVFFSHMKDWLEWHRLTGIRLG